jgi:hypothetical protein
MGNTVLYAVRYLQEMPALLLAHSHTLDTSSQSGHPTTAVGALTQPHLLIP